MGRLHAVYQLSTLRIRFAPKLRGNVIAAELIGTATSGKDGLMEASAYKNSIGIGLQVDYGKTKCIKVSNIPSLRIIQFYIVDANAHIYRYVYVNHYNSNRLYEMEKYGINAEIKYKDKIFSELYIKIQASGTAHFHVIGEVTVEVVDEMPTDAIDVPVA